MITGATMLAFLIGVTVGFGWGRITFTPEFWERGKVDE